jgi:hypothetical protein
MNRCIAVLIIGIHIHASIERRVDFLNCLK